MTNKILLSCLGLLAVAACASRGEGEQSAEEVAEIMSALKMRPGQWEATTEVLSANAPGIPPDTLRSMVGSKATIAKCVSPEEAAKPSVSFLLGQSGRDCTYSDFSAADGRMTGVMNCAAPGIAGRAVMKLEGKFSPVAYDMDMGMEAAMPGGAKMNVKARTTGRRIGECA